MAYPFLDQDSRALVRNFVAALRKNNGPLSGPVGQNRFADNSGYPPFILRSAPVRIAHAAGRSIPQRSGPPVFRMALGRSHRRLRIIFVPTGRRSGNGSISPADDKLVDCGNGRLSGLIAYCRLARRFADSEAEANGLRVTRQAMRDRLAFEFAHPKGGLILPAPTGRSVYARWRNLSPEVGRLLATFAGDIQKDLMATSMSITIGPPGIWPGMSRPCGETNPPSICRPRRWKSSRPAPGSSAKIGISHAIYRHPLVPRRPVLHPQAGPGLRILRQPDPGGIPNKIRGPYDSIYIPVARLGYNPGHAIEIDCL